MTPRLLAGSSGLVCVAEKNNKRHRLADYRCDVKKMPALLVLSYNVCRGSKNILKIYTLNSCTLQVQD